MTTTRVTRSGIVTRGRARCRYSIERSRLAGSTGSVPGANARFRWCGGVGGPPTGVAFTCHVMNIRSHMDHQLQLVAVSTQVTANASSISGVGPIRERGLQRVVHSEAHASAETYLPQIPGPTSTEEQNERFEVNRIKRLLVLCVASVAALVGLIVAAPSASALPAPHCEVNYVCGYTGYDFTGVKYRWNVFGLGSQCGTLPDATIFHSLANGSSYRFYWWEYGVCSGAASGLLQPAGQPGSEYSHYDFTSIRKT